MNSTEQSANFDPMFYTTFYPDVRTFSASNAKIHYLTHGLKENRVGNKNVLDHRVAETREKIASECVHLQTYFFGGTFSPLNETVIHIMIRTSSRPKEFDQCIQSILGQKYIQYHITVCYDTPDSMDYLLPYAHYPNIDIFMVDDQYKTMNEPYKFNLYCNDLMKRVTDAGCGNEDYMMFLDDDNVLSHPFVLSIINLYITSSCCSKIIVWRFGRPDQCITANIIKTHPSYPANVQRGTIDTSMVCFPASIVRPYWGNKQYGDHSFYSAVFALNPATKIFKIPLILTVPISTNQIGNCGKLPTINTSKQCAYIVDVPTNPVQKMVTHNCPFIFDWRFYLHIYSDLNFIHNEVEALNHYVQYGVVENRRTRVVIKLATADETPSPILIEKILPPNMPVHISSGLYSFSSRVISRYGWNLKNISDIDIDLGSTIFFGVYTDVDLCALKRCAGVRYIIWGGEDINISLNHSKQTLIEVGKLANCIHLSISRCIHNRVKRAFPTTSPILSSFNLVDPTLFFRGDRTHKRSSESTTIFIFNGQTVGREHIYGKRVYDEVMRRLPQYTYVFSNTLNLAYKDMPEFYMLCKCMLRLTSRDGNANSVQECEAMGIPVIHNFSDYGIKWATVNDVIEGIIYAC